MDPGIERQPKRLPNAPELKALRQVVDRIWPLQREWKGPRDTSSIAAHFNDASSGLELQIFIITASNSRTGDVSLSLMDLKHESNEERERIVQESVRGDIFSRTFFFEAGKDPRARAIFNSFCLIADTLQRESKGVREPSYRALDVGKAESVIVKELAKPIDFSEAFASGPRRLYCDDSERLVSGADTAWIDLSFSPDGTKIGLTFSQNVNGGDYNPYWPSICIREPFRGGSRYHSGRVHSALKVLLAADGIFPPPTQTGLTLPAVK